MKLYEAKDLLEAGVRLRKSYWREDKWFIMHGVWFFSTVGPFGHLSKERLTLDGVEYDLYSLSFNSIFIDEWVEVIEKSNAGFGLDF